MIIYKCILTGDEMFSDIFKITTSEDGLLYEVEGKLVTRSEGEISDSLIGGNASAEEVCEQSESAVESGVDIVLNHKLSKIKGFDKKAYVSHLKSYMKALKAKKESDGICPDVITAFQEEACQAAKVMVGKVAKIKDIEFFTGMSMDTDGVIGLLDFREDGETPYMLFMKCSLETEKC